MKTARKLLAPLAIALAALASSASAQSQVGVKDVERLGHYNNEGRSGVGERQSHHAPELSPSLLAGGIVLLTGGVLVMLGSRRRTTPSTRPT